MTMYNAEIVLEVGTVSTSVPLAR